MNKSIKPVNTKGKTARRTATLLALGVVMQSVTPLTAMADVVTKPSEQKSSAQVATAPSQTPVSTAQTPESTTQSQTPTSTAHSQTPVSTAPSQTPVSTAQTPESTTKTSESDTKASESTKQTSESKTEVSTVDKQSETPVTKPSSDETKPSIPSDKPDTKPSVSDTDKAKPDTKPSDSNKDKDKDKDKDDKNLPENKKTVIFTLAPNPYLTDQQRKDLNNEVNASTTNSELSAIQAKYAKLSSDTEGQVVNARSGALVAFSNLNSLTQTELDGYKSELLDAYTVQSVNSIVDRAKSNNLRNSINNANQAKQTPKQDEGSNIFIGHTTESQAYVTGGTIYGDASYARNQTTESFIKKIGEDARKLGLDNDVYASVMIAQAILESGSGNSGLASEPNYNLFGVKGSYKGQYASFATQEDSGGGSMYTIQSNFRKYPSYKESMEDYIKLIKGGISGNKDFYKQTWKSQTKTYKDATGYLQGHYATDTSYAEKLNGLIKTYNLTEYDHEKTEKVDPNFKPVSNADVDRIAGNMSLSQQDKVEQIAFTQLGVPYVFGGNEPGVGLDCSSFVQFVFSKVGITLPRTAQAQYDSTVHISQSQARKGDLIFFANTYSTSDYITHIGVYLGDGKYIQEGGANVHVTDVNEAYTQEHLVGFGRVINK